VARYELGRVGRRLPLEVETIRGDRRTGRADAKQTKGAAESAAADAVCGL
jgi:hypothetical protein